MRHFSKNNHLFTEIRQDDPLFIMTHGGRQCGRAGIYVSSDCPNTYREVIEESVKRKWLQSIAFVRNEEVTFELLNQ